LERKEVGKFRLPDGNVVDLLIFQNVMNGDNLVNLGGSSLESCPSLVFLMASCLLLGDRLLLLSKILLKSKLSLVLIFFDDFRSSLNGCLNNCLISLGLLNRGGFLTFLGCLRSSSLNFVFDGTPVALSGTSLYRTTTASASAILSVEGPSIVPLT